MYTALIIGIAGLLIWVICTRLELGSDVVDTFAAEHQAREEMRRGERTSHRHERWSAQQAVRWFKSVGIGLSVIGFGAALVYVLLGA
jgi:hypothetical protein